MKEKIKVYIYTRVSTAIQVDGFSLEAQKTKMKAFADYNGYEIVGEYEDAGKSGKSIEGRPAFNKMIEDIKSGKDGVSFVLVFKLSRFARNAADVLSTLQTMQDFGVNLICVEDNIDSSKDAGKLMISVLSAVAEIERDNIRVQTMEGRIQKARDGKWNGGFAPYGYKLVNGKLEIEENEAEVIRVIYDKYVNTQLGLTGIAKYLKTHGYKKVVRQNGKKEYFTDKFIKAVLMNPVYSGKIAFGRRKTEKVHGTRNEYKMTRQKEYLIAPGIHEAIVSEEAWLAAKTKIEKQKHTYSRNVECKSGRSHLLSSILKCPSCGASLYHNVNRKKKSDGTFYKEYRYYACKHRTGVTGTECTFNKQLNAEVIEAAVEEIICKLIKHPQFASFMKDKINSKVDTTEIELEIKTLEDELRKKLSAKGRILTEIDDLDPDDKHYIRRKSDLDERLYNMYDKINSIEDQLEEARCRKFTVKSEKLKADNIYSILLNFEKLYSKMNDEEKRELMSILVTEINIYEEPTENGQWLKEIKFSLPLTIENIQSSWDKRRHVSAVIKFSKGMSFPRETLPTSSIVSLFFTIGTLKLKLMVFTQFLSLSHSG